jgi:hypothetical protein
MTMNDKGEVFVKDLPVLLDDDEIRLRGLELNERMGEIDALDNALKKLKDEQKPKRLRINDRINEVRAQLGAKAELRPVECQEIIHYAQRSATKIRLDTGEDVSTRGLHPSEMQGNLLLLPGQSKATEASGEEE